MKDKGQPKEVAEGVLWGGFKGEHNLAHPYYILQDEEYTFEKDELFVADILKKFVRKRIRLTVEEIR